MPEKMIFMLYLLASFVIASTHDSNSDLIHRRPPLLYNLSGGTVNEIDMPEQTNNVKNIEINCENFLLSHPPIDKNVGTNPSCKNTELERSTEYNSFRNLKEKILKAYDFKQKEYRTLDLSEDSGREVFLEKKEVNIRIPAFHEEFRQLKNMNRDEGINITALHCPDPEYFLVCDDAAKLLKSIFIGQIGNETKIFAMYDAVLGGLIYKGTKIDLSYFFLLKSARSNRKYILNKENNRLFDHNMIIQKSNDIIIKECDNFLEKILNSQHLFFYYEMKEDVDMFKRILFSNTKREIGKSFSKFRTMFKSLVKNNDETSNINSQNRNDKSNIKIIPPMNTNGRKYIADENKYSAISSGTEKNIIKYQSTENKEVTPEIEIIEILPPIKKKNINHQEKDLHFIDRNSTTQNAEYANKTDENISVEKSESQNEIIHIKNVLDTSQHSKGQNELKNDQKYNYHSITLETTHKDNVFSDRKTLQKEIIDRLIQESDFLEEKNILNCGNSLDVFDDIRNVLRKKKHFALLIQISDGKKIFSVLIPQILDFSRSKSKLNRKIQKYYHISFDLIFLEGRFRRAQLDYSICKDLKREFIALQLGYVLFFSLTKISGDIAQFSVIKFDLKNFDRLKQTLFIDNTPKNREYHHKNTIIQFKSSKILSRTSNTSVQGQPNDRKKERIFEIEPREKITERMNRNLTIFDRKSSIYNIKVQIVSLNKSIPADSAIKKNNVPSTTQNEHLHKNQLEIVNSTGASSQQNLPTSSPLFKNVGRNRPLILKSSKPSNIVTHTTVQSNPCDLVDSTQKSWPPYKNSDNPAAKLSNSNQQISKHDTLQPEQTVVHVDTQLNNMENCFSHQPGASDNMFENMILKSENDHTENILDINTEDFVHIDSTSYQEMLSCELDFLGGNFKPSNSFQTQIFVSQQSIIDKAIQDFHENVRSNQTKEISTNQRDRNGIHSKKPRLDKGLPLCTETTQKPFLNQFETMADTKSPDMEKVFISSENDSSEIFSFENPKIPSSSEITCIPEPIHPSLNNPETSEPSEIT